MKEKMIEIPAREWEAIYDMANGAVDMDDAPSGVDEALLVERAKECCRMVLIAEARRTA